MLILKTKLGQAALSTINTNYYNWMKTINSDEEEIAGERINASYDEKHAIGFKAGQL